MVSSAPRKRSAPARWGVPPSFRSRPAENASPAPVSNTGSPAASRRRAMIESMCALESAFLPGPSRGRVYIAAGGGGGEGVHRGRPPRSAWHGGEQGRWLGMSRLLLAYPALARPSLHPAVGPTAPLPAPATP